MATDIVKGFLTVSGDAKYDFNGLQNIPTQTYYDSVIDTYLTNKGKVLVTESDVTKWNKAPTMDDFKISIPQPTAETFGDKENFYYYKDGTNYILATSYESGKTYYNYQLEILQIPNRAINVVTYTNGSSPYSPGVSQDYGAQENTLYVNTYDNSIWIYKNSAYVQITKQWVIGLTSGTIYDGDNGYQDYVHRKTIAGTDSTHPYEYIDPKTEEITSVSSTANPHNINATGLGLKIQGKDINGQDVTAKAFVESGRVQLSGANIGDVAMGILDAWPSFDSEYQPINGGWIRPETTRGFYLPLEAKNIFGSVMSINGIYPTSQNVPSGMDVVPYAEESVFKSYHNIELTSENIPGAINTVKIGSDSYVSGTEHYIEISTITTSQIEDLFT